MQKYPSHREADVVLRDGSTARVRPVRESDCPAVEKFLAGLSLESIASRFFTGAVDHAKMARWCVDVDYENRFGLVATLGSKRTVIGHAMYVRIGKDRAEVALEVADAYQGHGLGTLLLEHLAEAAAEHSISVFEGHVRASNHRMIKVFRDSGFPVTTHSEPGEILCEFPTALTPDGVERFERREQIAAAAALRSFLYPSSVAVIGAGRDRTSISGATFHNLLTAGFAGPVYPVNSKSEVVQSVIAYPRVADIRHPVELAVITVPAHAVTEVVRECGEKGVRALVVISAGFAETGSQGRELQREILAECRSAGMRLIGPNCMGILNTAPGVMLNATFAPAFPPRGHVGFLSQSGALGLAVIDYASTFGLGISSFVSVGNKADISGNDLIQYWDTDDDTDLILLYLESFGNPRKFARIARSVGKRKPIVAVKSGRSSSGARATSSHTGALLASDDATVNALFEQAGVIRTDSLAEMFEIASLLEKQPAPKGNRVAIITNAGGPGILCADACESLGLSVPPLSDAVREALAFLPVEASMANPIDMIASATGDDYRRTIQAVAQWDGIDSIIVIFIPPLRTGASEVAEAIRASVAGLQRELTVLSVFMSSRGVPPELGTIPSYPFPEEAARALARAVRYGVWRSQPEGSVRAFDDLRSDEAASVISHKLETGGGWLPPNDVWKLLSCYGLPLCEQRVVRSARAAAKAARELGGVVALKGVAPDLLHKTEAGAVQLGLDAPAEVAHAASTMLARFIAETGRPLKGFIVQSMAEPGVEAFVGVASDPVFGPVIACGAGGTTVELIHDVSVRLTPITEQDASAMIRSLKTYPLFEGYRGAPHASVSALEDVLLRISALVEAHDEIIEMDLNPVMVSGAGAVIVDARIKVGRQAPRRPLGARRMN